jgi:biopolymer transport protein ExbD
MALRSPKPAGMGFGMPLWIGITLILLGLITYGSIQHWMTTRIFVPVDMPVSLAPGHIKTGAFSINLRDGYSIWIDLDHNVQWDANCNAHSSLQTRWVLRTAGRVVEEWESPVLFGTYLEGFFAERGTYELDVEVTSDASCLNPAHPRLRVNTSKRAYSEKFSLLLWLSVMFVGVGFALLVLFGIGRTGKQPIHAESDGSRSVVQYFQWAQRLPLEPAVSGLPSFGLVCALVLSWLVMFHILFYELGRPHSKGIMVSLMRHVPPAEVSERWAEPMVLRVQSAGPDLATRLYLNSKPLSWEELNSGLKAELSQRSVWVVYVEVDSNLPWQDALSAIDAARGLHATIVLLTAPTGTKQR